MVRPMMVRKMAKSAPQITATAVAHTEFYRAFGAAVCEARGAHTPPLTQAELALRIGLSRTSVVNIEAGRQGVLLHAGMDIARALNISLEALLKRCIAAAREAEIAGLQERINALRAEQSNPTKHSEPTK